MVSKGKKIAFISTYPFDTAPGQRFRFEQYYRFLKEKGYLFSHHSFFDESTNRILYKKGFLLKKIMGVITGFFRRIFLLPRLANCQYVFIHREMAPVGPPVFEWITAKLLRKKIIFDFDDAIWLPNVSEHNRFADFFKSYYKVKWICKWAYKISCGNEFLCSYARRFNNRVVYNPTTIDTGNYHNRVKNQDTADFVIGWTGSHSTLPYLNDLFPVLAELEKKYSFRFLVISDKSPVFPLASLWYIPWNKTSEIEDLLKMNVGVMPLQLDEWAQGKCGFKALQYMSLGIPALVSPVGVNAKIVDHGINGFLCADPGDWKKYLSLLMEDRELLKKLSSQTQSKIEQYYSVNSNRLNFLSLFE